MQGTTTTEGQRHKTRRIKPAFDGYKPDGASHFRIRDTQNGLSRRHGIQAKRCADMLFNCGLCCRDIKACKCATNGPRGVDPAQAPDWHRSGSGDHCLARSIPGQVGCLRFPAPLAANHRDPPRDGTTARANRGDFDHRRTDHHAEINRRLRR